VLPGYDQCKDYNAHATCKRWLHEDDIRYIIRQLVVEEVLEERCESTGNQMYTAQTVHRLYRANTSKARELMNGTRTLTIDLSEDRFNTPTKKSKPKAVRPYLDSDDELELGHSSSKAVARKSKSKQAATAQPSIGSIINQTLQTPTTLGTTPAAAPAKVSVATHLGITDRLYDELYDELRFINKRWTDEMIDLNVSCALMSAC